MSLARMMIEFAAPPRYPARIPSTPPKRHATTIGVSPASSVIRPPNSSRLSMSRPCSSVPSGCPTVPIGDSRIRMLPAAGSYGASAGARTAARTIAPRSEPAISVVGSRARRRLTRRQYDVTTGAAAGAVKVAGTLTSASHDPRVDQALQDVDGEVEEHERRREDEDDALEERHVALKDGDVQQVPGAGPREHRLDEDGSPERKAELQAHHGENLRRGVLQHVPHERARVEPFHPQREDELLREDVEHRRAHDARDDAERDERERDRGQQHVTDVGPDARV